ncbi:MAG: cytochrome c oxidase subunit 4 [Actinomycetota bacterium]|nr:cytochrome c oxidase subunit 4 [Actinomycetota bacterium]
MNTLSRICLGLAAFLAVTGGVYGFTSHEHAGTVELLLSAVTFCFLGIILRLVGSREAEGEPEEEAEIQVAPTIWPFGFAISGVILAVGLIVSQWIVILGGLAAALSAAGWLRDVSRSHAGEAP